MRYIKQASQIGEWNKCLVPSRFRISLKFCFRNIPGLLGYEQILLRRKRFKVGRYGSNYL